MARPRRSPSPRRTDGTEETARTSNSDSSASEWDESGNQGDDSQYHSMIGTASWTMTPLVTPPVLTGTPVVSPALPDTTGATPSFGFQKKVGLLPA
eukprot:9989316-Heterocapsa_arctica.AAC.1